MESSIDDFDLLKDDFIYDETSDKNEVTNTMSDNLVNGKYNIYDNYSPNSYTVETIDPNMMKTNEQFQINDNEMVTYDDAEDINISSMSNFFFFEESDKCDDIMNDELSNDSSINRESSDNNNKEDIVLPTQCSVESCQTSLEDDNIHGINLYKLIENISPNKDQKAYCIGTPKSINIMEYNESESQIANPESTIVWRKHFDDSGHEQLESNTNLVQWSDGSWSLVIGGTYYKCDFYPENSFLLSLQNLDKIIVPESYLERKATIRPYVIKGNPQYNLHSQKSKRTRLTAIMDSPMPPSLNKSHSSSSINNENPYISTEKNKDLLSLNDQTDSYNFDVSFFEKD